MPLREQGAKEQGAVFQHRHISTTNGDPSSKAVHKEIRLPVQRLVLILPVEEQSSDNEGSVDEHNS